MSAFDDLVHRMRLGDDAATAEIFHRYAADVKRIVSAWMRIDRIRRLADPSDIYQSVMASFFIRAALGRYDIAGPDQLKALLVRIARHKVADVVRGRGARASFVPIGGNGLSWMDPADPAKGPASQVMWKDLLQKFRDRFTEAERRVSDLRMLGYNWEEVGAALGERPGTVRTRLDRALKRICREIQLEELSDE
jgi:RNA polymerase sigma factor (sigma-70 family)